MAGYCGTGTRANRIKWLVAGILGAIAVILTILAIIFFALCQSLVTTNSGEPLYDVISCSCACVRLQCDMTDPLSMQWHTTSCEVICSLLRCGSLPEDGHYSCIVSACMCLIGRFCTLSDAVSLHFLDRVYDASALWGTSK
jgi:hypothetical protein